MKHIIDFLRDLSLNNNREWFESNRERYKQAQREFNALTEELIAGISAFDPSVAGLTVKDCTYRIYRDVRFSPNKSPYKTHMGVYICPHGKKSGYAGYYLHVEPYVEGLGGGSIITSGLYMPEPNVLRSVRYEITDNFEMFEKCIGKAKGFSLDRENSLKRLPKGFEPGNKYDEYLKLKDVYLFKNISDDYLLQEDVVDVAVRDFALTADFVALLNRAVTWAFEEGTDD